MSDISNKTLVALLVIAIVVSLAGTWISIGKLKSVTGFYQQGTSPAGTVQLTKQTVIEITLYNETINFGTGYVNATGGNKYCTINTTMAAASTTSGVGNTFAPTFAGSKDSTDKCLGSFVIPGQGFEVVNTGTVAVDVTMNSSTGSTWLDGPTNAGWYQYRMSDEGDGCTEGDLATWTNITTGMNAAVCSDLAIDTAKNAFQVALQVKVPSDLVNGTKTDTITFTAAAS